MGVSNTDGCLVIFCQKWPVTTLLPLPDDARLVGMEFQGIQGERINSHFFIWQGFNSLTIGPQWEYHGIVREKELGWHLLTERGMSLLMDGAL